MGSTRRDPRGRLHGRIDTFSRIDASVVLTNMVGKEDDPLTLVQTPMSFIRLESEDSVRTSNKSVRKEVIQPQVPLRLPCYDLVPITELAFGAVFPKVRQSDFERSPLSWLDGRCVQGSGTYSPRHG